jgi:hypothetical protein
MTTIKRIALVLACALFYYLIFYLNKLLFDTYEFSYGVNWVFIPSGFQLLLVLVAIFDGAIGIALASFVIGLESYYLDTVVRTLITGLISGGSPLLARKICFDFLGVDKELKQISPKAILQMSIVFALISATLHQLWFFYNGKSDAFLQSLLVMALGNLLGTALVLTALRLLTSKIHKVNL